jgi:8-oxo-dGTP pyrophosphatase MutT (NUDIX family)
MSFGSTSLAASQVEEIATIDFRLEHKPWPFASERAREIDAHWEELVRRNPQHYNGRVLLMRDLSRVAAVSGCKLQGTCFVAEYKAFLAWRDFGCPDASIRNSFAMAALRSADGAFLLGEMGASTANAGRLYFPAGTPEPSDIVDGAIDLEANVLRELEEETGLTASEVALDPGWTVVFQGPRVACMKTMRSTRSASELMAQSAAFIAAEQQPELVRLLAVFGTPDLDDKRMPDFILTYLRHAFAKV